MQHVNRCCFSQLHKRSVMSSSVEGMMCENILYLFPNLGICTIRHDGA